MRPSDLLVSRAFYLLVTTFIVNIIFTRVLVGPAGGEPMTNGLTTYQCHALMEPPRIGSFSQFREHLLVDLIGKCIRKRRKRVAHKKYQPISK